MKTFRNSDLVRAGRLIPNRATLCYHDAKFCYHIFAGKTLHGKNQIWRPRLGKVSEHFVNILSSLHFDIASKCPLTKLGES